MRPFWMGAGFGTITNDDVRTLSVDDVTQTEGTSPAGFTLYTFTVTLSAQTITSDVTVQVAIARTTGRRRSRGLHADPAHNVNVCRWRPPRR